jgi:hypothetical protein
MTPQQTLEQFDPHAAMGMRRRRRPRRPLFLKQTRATRLQINAQNRVPRKTCDSRDPTRNVVGGKPQGGGPTTPACEPAFIDDPR